MELLGVAISQGIPICLIDLYMCGHGAAVQTNGYKDAFCCMAERIQLGMGILKLWLFFCNCNVSNDFEKGEKCEEVYLRCFPRELNLQLRVDSFTEPYSSLFETVQPTNVNVLVHSVIFACRQHLPLVLTRPDKVSCEHSEKFSSYIQRCFPQESGASNQVLP